MHSKSSSYSLLLLLLFLLCPLLLLLLIHAFIPPKQEQLPDKTYLSWVLGSERNRSMKLTFYG